MRPDKTTDGRVSGVKPLRHERKLCVPKLLLRAKISIATSNDVMTDAEKRAQARRERMTIRKGRLGDPEVDFSPVSGAEALSLVHRLTLTSFALAVLPQPTYTRAQIPCRFVPRRSA